VDEHMERSPKLWREAAPLILASRSAGRRLVLAQTGIPFKCIPAEVDERLLETDVLTGGGGPDQVVATLARAKAQKISHIDPEALVVGADQAASCEGRLFGKPGTPDLAREQLRFLSGRTHRLHSALALVRGGEVLFETIAHADLRMRTLSDEFIDAYLAATGGAIVHCSGCYQIEGLGVHLFESVVGDQWTILGLPILPLLSVLRERAALVG
jgi:septum formation protein